MAREPQTARPRARGRVAPLSLKRGAYITDGARLVQIRHVSSDRVVGEDGRSPTDAPETLTLGRAELADGGWRNVAVKDFDVDGWWREVIGG